MSLIRCIKRNKMKVFRRMYVRRRMSSTGNYEAAWVRIPDAYIKQWGTVTISLEDIKPNFIKYGALTMNVVNNDGYFSTRDQNDSIFYGTLGLNKTLVKIEAGYIDTDGTEYPASPSIFVGVISEEDTKYKYNNEVQLKVNHISKIFEEFPANDVAGLGSTQTASDLIGKIRDHVDGAAVAIFQKYISLTAWNITATSNTFNLASSTSLQNITTWKFMQKLSEAENYTMYVDNQAQFWFKEKSAVAASITYHFSGVGDADRTWGHNIMQNIEIDSGLDTVYNRVRIKYASEDTTSSYYTKKETWNWGDSSSSYRFGIRTYEYENTWLSPTTAAAIATTIYNEYAEPKERVTIDAKFVPQLDVMDRVSLTYQSNVTKGGDLWGFFTWDVGIWGGNVAYNINITNSEYKVIDIKHNLDKFVSTVKMVEIV